MYFVAEDGTKFQNLDECADYEASINRKKQQKEKRLKELEIAREKYESLEKKFFEDYPDELDLDLSHLKRLFSIY